MKNKSKISPGQLTIFEQIVYGDKNYKNLRDAMICAIQDFYIKKIFPSNIIATNNIYDLKAMKKYWRLYEIYNIYY
jgi:hypothetical protein